MKNWSKYLFDPLTGRRFLPEGAVWVGNKNNVEDFYSINNLERNCRDLKTKLYLLQQKVDFVLNSRLLLPTRNKYTPQAQALDKLEPCLLRHNNGVVKKAVPGVHYVDYSSFSNGNLCAIHPSVSSEGQKFITASDITIPDIRNHFEEFHQYQVTVNNHYENIVENITNIENNITNITEEITNINQTIEYHTQEIYNVNNEINNINNNITNINQNYQNITNKINNINNNIEYNIQNIQEQINNIDNSVNNIYEQIHEDIDIDLGDFELQLQAQLNMINNLIAQVNALVAAVAEINAVIAGIIAQINNLQIEQGGCIAWAMGNDMLTVCYND